MKELIIVLGVVIMLALLFTYPTIMIDIVGTILIIAFVSPFVIGVGGALKENNQTKDTL